MDRRQYGRIIEPAIFHRHCVALVFGGCSSTVRFASFALQCGIGTGQVLVLQLGSAAATHLNRSRLEVKFEDCGILGIDPEENR